MLSNINKKIDFLKKKKKIKKIVRPLFLHYNKKRKLVLMFRETACKTGVLELKTS